MVWVAWAVYLCPPVLAPLLIQTSRSAFHLYIFAPSFLHMAVYMTSQGCFGARDLERCAVGMILKSRK